MEVGSWAEWANAGGSFLAFLGAAVAAFIAWKSYSREGRLRRREEKEEQARRVAVWLYHGENKWKIRMANTNSLPVYDMRAYVHAEGLKGGPVELKRGTQGPCPSAKVFEWTRRVNRILAKAETIGRVYDIDKTYVTVKFTDTNGIRWERDQKGKLTDISRSTRA